MGQRERAYVIRRYVEQSPPDPNATKGEVTIEIRVAYPPGANLADLFVEMGSAMVSTVAKIVERHSTEAEPWGVDDLRLQGDVADEALISVLRALAEDQDQLNPEKGNDNAHVA